MIKKWVGGGKVQWNGKRLCRKVGCVAKFHRLIHNPRLFDEPIQMINLKGMHYPKHVILFAVFFYVRYGVSYRDLENIMQERGVNVDHATLKPLGR